MIIGASEVRNGGERVAPVRAARVLDDGDTLQANDELADQLEARLGTIPMPMLPPAALAMIIV